MNLEELVNIMAALRGPNGCPWDKKQTRQSLKAFLHEEAHEVLEALDENNPESIKEELGDLLFQIVFHCQIAKEQGEFDIADVIKGISQKMTARHPHVFGSESFQTPEEVLVHWEKHKRQEKKHQKSILEGVPRSMPALILAHSIQERASRVGFDWSESRGATEKLDEEISEFKAALESKERQHMEEELGDILFSLVNISRFIGVNPEDALKKTIKKFTSRFQFIEQKAAERGKSLSEMALSEMDSLWEQAKTCKP
jgi:tetrapyrrole methylase family protein/MazG family protein